MKVNGWQIVGIDPGETTGLAWGIFGRREIEKYGWLKSLERAIKKKRIVFDEISNSGISEQEQVCQIIAWIQAQSNLGYRISDGRVPAINAISIESFILQQRSMDKSLLSPVRVISGIKQMIYIGRIVESDDPSSGWTYGSSGLISRVEERSASLVKGIITDERLHKWGAWVPGSSHKRDALRQLIYELRTQAERNNNGK